MTVKQEDSRARQSLVKSEHNNEPENNEVSHILFDQLAQIKQQSEKPKNGQFGRKQLRPITQQFFSTKYDQNQSEPIIHPRTKKKAKQIYKLLPAHLLETEADDKLQDSKLSTSKDSKS